MANRIIEKYTAIGTIRYPITAKYTAVGTGKNGNGWKVRNNSTNDLTSLSSSQATTLKSEDAHDNSVNCLDLAKDYLESLDEDQLANSKMIFLKDLRKKAQLGFISRMAIGLNLPPAKT